MMPDRINEIKQRCEKATIGPWEWQSSDCEDDHLVAPSAPVRPKQGGCLEIPREVLGTSEWMRADPEDAEFIAHARENIPY